MHVAYSRRMIGLTLDPESRALYQVLSYLNGQLPRAVDYLPAGRVAPLELQGLWLLLPPLLPLPLFLASNMQAMDAAQGPSPDTWLLSWFASTACPSRAPQHMRDVKLHGLARSGANMSHFPPFLTPSTPSQVRNQQLHDIHGVDVNRSSSHMYVPM